MKKKKQNQLFYSEKVLGFNVLFFSYPQLINLIEEIFVYQVYQFNSTIPNPVIIDCGSNIGLSVIYFKKLYPECQILTFEPDPLTFSLLQQNVSINKLETISCYNVALSDVEGEVLLYKKASSPGSLNMSLVKSNLNDSAEIVKCKRLSDFIDRNIEMVKIDAEGSEVNIIKDLKFNNKMNLINQMVIKYHLDLNSMSFKEFKEVLNGSHFQVEEKKPELYEHDKDTIVKCVTTRILGASNFHNV